MQYCRKPGTLPLGGGVLSLFLQPVHFSEFPSGVKEFISRRGPHLEEGGHPILFPASRSVKYSLATLKPGRTKKILDAEC